MVAELKQASLSGWDVSVGKFRITMEARKSTW